MELIDLSINMSKVSKVQKAQTGNESFGMEEVRGGLHPAVDTNRLNKKKMFGYLSS